MCVRARVCTHAATCHTFVDVNRSQKKASNSQETRVRGGREPSWLGAGT